MTGTNRAVLIAALAIAGCTPAPAADIERLDVRLILRADGSVAADERLHARLAGDRFRLRKPLDRQDAIVDLQAFIDGAAATGADEARGARLSAAGGLDVEWRVPGPGSYQLEVRYRAVGAVAVRGGHAALSWPILPSSSQLAPAAVDLTLELPAGTQLSGEPYVETGHGWTVTRQDDVIRAQARAISDDRGATLVVPFFVDPRAIDEPIWQRDALRARDLLPSFISGALFILVVAAGALVMIGVQYPRASGGPPRAVTRGLRVAGVVTIVFGLLSVPVTEWGLGRYGRWAHAIPLSVIVSGIAFVVYGMMKGRRPTES